MAGGSLGAASRSLASAGPARAVTGRGGCARPVRAQPRQDRLGRARLLDAGAGRPLRALAGDDRGIDGFYYSPVFAFAFAPFGALPWPVFLAGWMAVMLAALAWLGGRWYLALVALYPIALELAYGNIYLPLAAALVLGLRYPALWAVFPLTKVTPGIVWLWFVARGEWRNLAVAAGTTAALVTVCYLVAPGMWADWIIMLGGNASAPTHDILPVPLVVRLPLAAVLIVWGARTDRAWVLPIGLLLSLPTFWTTSFTVLLACMPLAWPSRDRVAMASQRGGSPPQPSGNRLRPR